MRATVKELQQFHLAVDCLKPRSRYACAVGEGELVGIDCEAETLLAVATRLARYGPTEGAPDWLVSGVWLRTDAADYIATASAVVLANGCVARPLSIHRPVELMRRIQAELPNVSARLVGRNDDIEMPDADHTPDPPPSLHRWPSGPYSTHVLARASQRHATISSVACALLMESETVSLLVGTDPSTLAMVLSEDAALIGRYRADCEALSPEEYLERCG
jgi:hypothetical protein